jgi:predicted transcriptional regulator
MNVTLSLDDELVRKVRRIAAGRDTTLTAMIRDHLERVAAAEDDSGRKRRELEALERSFCKFRFHVGPRTWKREDLHERS